MDEKSTWIPTWRTMDKISYMVSRNFRHAYLQEVGLKQISGDHYLFSNFFSMTNFKTYFRTDSRANKHHQVVLSNCTRRKLVHYNRPLRLSHLRLMLNQEYKGFVPSMGRSTPLWQLPLLGEVVILQQHNIFKPNNGLSLFVAGFTNNGSHWGGEGSPNSQNVGIPKTMAMLLNNGKPYIVANAPIIYSYVPNLIIL